MMANRSSGLPVSWRYTLRQAVWAAADIVFPPRCAGCGRAGARFCKACQVSLAALAPPVCDFCGYPLAEENTRPCLACRQAAPGARAAPNALAGIRSAAFFEGPLRQALHSLKYKRDIILADTLAQVLVEAWRAYGLPGDLVLPVPLSRERLRERGYNQAALLARGFADLAGLAYTPTGAARVRPTASQVGLSASRRWENLAGAFKGESRAVAGRTVMLIDDVCTTGSTLRACAEALKAAGAAGVWGLTVARARRAVGIS
jgi:competence protein ComFC